MSPVERGVHRKREQRGEPVPDVVDHGNRGVPVGNTDVDVAAGRLVVACRGSIEVVDPREPAR